ncbi:MAG: hypothetical protein SGI88_19530 [Candidatus Hydrogenedentes bacterium]|nr:hypothetical protein [Candidatus Hydrogenedentota bacterium]
MRARFAYRIVSIAACLIVGMSAPIDSQPSLIPIPDCVERLHTNAPLDTAGQLLSELELFDTGDITQLDEYWPRIDLLAFVMGRLLSEDELTAFLNTMNKVEHGTTGELILAAFWSEYGEERVPRRLSYRQQKNDRADLVELATSSENLVRAAALISIIRRKQPNEEFNVTAALNNLMSLAPTLNETSSAALFFLSSHVAERWSSHHTPADLNEFFGYSGCSDDVIALLAETPICADILPNLQQGFTETLLEAAGFNSDYATRRWCADLLAETGVKDAVMPDGADPLLVRAFIESAVEAGNPLVAYQHLVSGQPGDIFRGKDCGTLNALGMSLVRDGSVIEAIEVFGILADAFPGSQLAVNAEEHIQHLSAIQMSQANREHAAARATIRSQP